MEQAAATVHAPAVAGPVRLGRKTKMLVKRLRRVRSRATIREVDQRGNPRISSRLFTLRSK